MSIFTKVHQTLVPRGDVKHGPLPPLLVAMTLVTGLVAADSHLVGGSGSKAGRRLIAVAAMFVGALVGSLLIFHVSIVSPLVIALIVIAGVAVTARLLSTSDPAWVHTS